MFTLIIMIFTIRGTAVSSVEFANQVTCESAKKQLVQEAAFGKNIIAFCVQK